MTVTTIAAGRDEVHGMTIIAGVMDLTVAARAAMTTIVVAVLK